MSGVSVGTGTGAVWLCRCWQLLGGRGSGWWCSQSCAWGHVGGWDVGSVRWPRQCNPLSRDPERAEWLSSCLRWRWLEGGKLVFLSMRVLLEWAGSSTGLAEHVYMYPTNYHALQEADRWGMGARGR